MKVQGAPITPAGMAALKARYDHLLGTERLYTAAQTEVRLVHPRTLGLDRLGHFGVFRPGIGESLWIEIRAQLLATLSATG